MLGREVVEGEQRCAVLGQARRGLVVLGPILVDETVEGGFGIGAALRLVDGVQVLLGLALHRFRQGVEDVGRLVDPTSLLPGRRPDLVQGLPEAQGTIAGGELGSRGETVLVAQPEQQLTPALATFAIAVLDREQLLAAIGSGADEDEDALPVVVGEQQRWSPA